MTEPTIRLAYPRWPFYNRQLRDVVATLTDEQLAIQPSPGRWPLWATIGHLACQRVFGLCDVAGEPGAETTPFTNASYDCPGDDDLEHVLSASDLVAGTRFDVPHHRGSAGPWTPAMLGDTVRHREWGDDAAQTRGEVISRSFAHDVSHITEINETLSRAGLPMVDIWGD